MTFPIVIKPSGQALNSELLRQLRLIQAALGDSATGFVTLDTTQTITGDKTFTIASLVVSAGTSIVLSGSKIFTSDTTQVGNSIILQSAALKFLGSTFANTISSIEPAADRAISLKDVGADSSLALVLTGSPKLASGTYTPTLFNVANLSASTAYQCQYMRLGDTVTVSGMVDIDPILAATSTQLGISIPVASNFAANEDCAGVAFSYAIAGQGAAIIADGANDRAQLQYIAGDITNQSMLFTFSYQII